MVKKSLMSRILSVGREDLLLPEKVLNRVQKSWLSGYHGNSSKPEKRFSKAFFVQTTHSLKFQILFPNSFGAVKNLHLEIMDR